MSSRITRFLRQPATVAVLGTTVAAGGAIVYLASRKPIRDDRRVILKCNAAGRVIPPQFPKIKTRAEQLLELRKHDTSESEYDLVIIGGGATGTGIALDAVTRGLKVALVERGDFASGTSSKSTKLVHGGVRYLEKAFWELDWGQMQLVREALSERKAFLHIAPHLSQSLPILLPLYKWWQAPYFRVGTLMYDLLAGSQRLEGSYLMGRNKTLEEFPLLKRDGLIGGLVYYDGQHNDSRMNISLATTAALYGATVANYVQVSGLEKDATGAISGVKVQDCFASDDGFTIRAKGVINATGPFSDAVRKMDDPTLGDIVAPSSGIHVVLPRKFSPKSMGVLDAATSDGRLLFILPWEGRTVAGTTDNPCSLEQSPSAGDGDIDFVLKEARKMLGQDIQLSRADVLATWSGIRPLVRDPNAKDTQSLVRSHLIMVSKSGLLTCAGGKWTTYRNMAEEAVDEAMRVFNLKPQSAPVVSIGGLDTTSDLEPANPPGKCQTWKVRLMGAHGWNVEGGLDAALSRQYSVDADVAHHLASNYGDRAWELLEAANGRKEDLERLSDHFPFLVGEIRHGIRNEYAQTAADVLSRRMRLAFLDVGEARHALPKVIEVLGEELKWSKAKMAHEFDAAVKFLQSMGLTADARSPSLNEQTIRGHVGSQVDKDTWAEPRDQGLLDTNR